MKDVNTIEIEIHNFLIKVTLSNCHVQVSYLDPDFHTVPHCSPHCTRSNMLKVSAGTKPARKRSIVSFSEDNPTVIGVSDGPQSGNQDQASPGATAGQLTHVTTTLLNIYIVSVLDGHKWTDSLRINKRKMSHEVPDDKDKDKPSD